MTNRDPDFNLDRIFNAARESTPSSEATAQVAGRVRDALRRGESGAPDETTVSLDAARRNDAARRGSTRIDNYSALVAPYLDGELTDGQRILFEEELHRVAALRREVNRERARREAPAIDLEPPKRPWLKLAAAAVVGVLGIALAIQLGPRLPSFDQSDIARVDAIEGTIFEVTDTGLVALAPDRWIDGGTQLRTAADSVAFIELDDGSIVEIDERSQLALVRHYGGNRVNVDRGRIIVEASERDSGALNVATEDVLVTVKGTIFGVAHGAKGSRVAVVEGEVEVNHAGVHHNLMSGQHLGTRLLAANDVRSDIEWSQDAERYVGMLDELADLQDEINAIVRTPARYQSRLIELVPADTVIYVGVPNASAKITEAYDLIRERLATSERFAELWRRAENEGELEHVDELMGWLRDISEHIGDETVLALVYDETAVETDGFVPVVLSEVAQAGLGETLQATIDAIVAKHGDGGEIEIAIIDSPAAARDGQVSVWITGDLMVASVDAEAIQSVAQSIVSGTSGFVGSDFHAVISDAYSQGTQYLGAVDLGTFIAMADADEALTFSGVGDLSYAVFELETTDDGSERTLASADIRFSAERQGVAAWLRDPSSMGSLEFFSSETQFVQAILIEEPSRILDDIERFAAQHEGNEGDDFDDLEAELNAIGLSLRDDILGTLSGEIAVGIDGPMIPTPSWKVVVEVYDENRVIESIQIAVDAARERVAEENASITMAAVDHPSIDAYRIQGAGSDESGATHEVEIHLATLDGYLIVTPTLALLERAERAYSSGTSITSAGDFRDLLPADQYLNFSAVAFSRLGQLIHEAVSLVPREAMSDEQVQALRDVSSIYRPSLFYAYAESDRLRFVLNSPSGFPFSAFAELIQSAMPWNDRGDDDDGSGDADAGDDTVTGRA